MRNLTGSAVLAVVLAGVGTWGCDRKKEGTGGRTPPSLERIAAPTTLDLQPGFTPEKTRLESQAHLAMHGIKGCVLESRNGVTPIYVTKALPGSTEGDVIAVGDVIVAVNGKPLTGNVIDKFRNAVREARPRSRIINLTRWRDGRTETFDLEVLPKPPDLTKGGKKDDNHDWNLGATGARGWIWGMNMATTDARQILITSVQAGTPADGVLREGDIVIGVGGRPFDSDARVAYARALTEAEKEENEGRLDLVLWRGGKRENATVKMKAMGTYSDTSPFDCPKSRKIMDAACEHLVANGFGGGIPSYVNALALLATGKAEYLPRLKEFAGSVTGKLGGMPCWGGSYSNLFLTEYYLATGDESVLPKISILSGAIARGQSWVGTWGHSFADPKTDVLGGYGAMNQCGIICAMSLVMAQKCGVNSPEIEKAVSRAQTFFSYYINKGAVPYGDHRPGFNVHDDNGKCSSTAVFFDLAGNREGAAFFSRMAVASYSVREWGHTGNYWSYLWAAPGAIRAGEEACAAFLREMHWYFDLERKCDGSFRILGQPGYRHTGNFDTTGARVLMYALPLKKLYITGKGLAIDKPLSGRDLDATIFAGRGVTWVKNSAMYEDREADELLPMLSSWSPAVRYRAGQALGRKKVDSVPALLKTYKEGGLNAKLGALVALEYQGDRAAPAVPFLADLLDHEDARVRISAMYALSRIGRPARAAVPKMLEVATMRFKDDPRNMTLRNLCFCLFCPGGPLGINGLLAESLEGVDGELLFPAVRAMLKADDGRARGCVAQLYKLMSFEELEPIWPDIFAAAKNQSPSGVMFASSIRLSGMKLFADNKVKEGLPLFFKVMDTEKWGKNRRIMALLRSLHGYGPEAMRLVLPQMKALEKELAAHREPKMLAPHRELLAQMIAEAEAARGQPRLFSIGLPSARD